MAVDHQFTGLPVGSGIMAILGFAISLRFDILIFIDQLHKHGEIHFHRRFYQPEESKLEYIPLSQRLV